MWCRQNTPRRRVAEGEEPDMSISGFKLFSDLFDGHLVTGQGNFWAAV
jgi:hypothetical protein